MNKIKSGIMILIMLMSIGIASAEDIGSKQLIAKSSIYSSISGEEVYQITYPNGGSEVVLERNTLQPGFIMGVSEGYDQAIPNGAVAIYTMELQGISSAVDGLRFHGHELIVTDVNTGNVLFEETISLADPDSYPSSSKKTVSINLGTFANDATYAFFAQEYVYLLGGKRATGDSHRLTLKVGTGTITPPTPVTSVFHLNYGGSCCGSGTYVSYTLTKNGNRINEGTFQIPSSSSSSKDAYAASFCQCSAADTLYINGVLYRQGTVISTPTPTPIVTGGKVYMCFDGKQVTDLNLCVKPKVVIIPPSISRLWDIIWSSIKGFLGLTIMGGQSVTTTVNQPYSTTLILSFAAPDIVSEDGTYQAKFGEWVIADASGNILKESGWSSQLTTSPYTVTATFTPTSPAKYYLIGVIDSQQYKWDGTNWLMTESIETKEVQVINAQLPGVTTKPPALSWSAIWTWILSLFGIK